MSTPVTVDFESNDSLDRAVDITLDSLNANAIIQGAVSLDLENNPGVDNTEDVDLYSFDLTAGDTIAVDVDAMQNDSLLEASITLFDGSGNTLITDVGEFP